jgi:peptidoglycan-N-acetylglucosamine deacetylase
MRNMTYVLITAGAVYTLVPWIVTRLLGIGVFRKGAAPGKIALTFDDGPNPLYTPQLLDMLKRHHAQATFFVVGEKAEQYPDLIRRIHEEGHQIGLHNYRHKSNWLMTPWTVRSQLKRSAEAVEAITGERPVYYRPPWGIFNVCDLLLRKQYTFVLWSLMAGDWRSRVGRTQLKSTLLSRIEEGSVVLLHDCGETWGADRDAPGYMLLALEDVLQELDTRGISSIRIDELSQGLVHTDRTKAVPAGPLPGRNVNEQTSATAASRAYS